MVEIKHDILNGKPKSYLNMCLSIPGELIEIINELDETFRVGKVSFDGIIKEVSLTLVPEAVVGDYVLVHVGAAISIVDEDEAKKTFELLKQLDELHDLDVPEGD
jgi:hydrogenase expression/formation protein HypC